VIRACLAALAVASLAGCQAKDPLRARIGRSCTVQVKRDLLGGSSSLPIGPNTTNSNGVEVSVGGTLEQATPDFLVLRVGPADQPSREYVIPRSNVLLIQFEPQNTP
jgi:hypothetical protein